MITELYADGGVIGANPSMIGGTYAYYLRHEDGSGIGSAFAIGIPEMGSPVTNNQTEMLALLRGLEQLPADFHGTVYSDSAVTLGRVFSGWKWKNVPNWMHKIYQSERRRLIRWSEICYVLLDGHPTRAQLQAGVGKRGHQVSEFNVWCDEYCRQIGEVFLETIGQNIPTIYDSFAAGKVSLLSNELNRADRA